MITRNKRAKKTIPQQQVFQGKQASQTQQAEQESVEQKRFQENYIPPIIIGREAETQIINQFIEDCILDKVRSKVLYISGVPGVGKTLTTMQIVGQIVKSTNKTRMKYINAMQLKAPTDIYEAILKGVGGIKSRRNRTETLVQLQGKLGKMKQHLLLTIDQVDYLMTKDQSVFYNMFEWANTKSKLILILIGNTIDFPEKLTGKISSRMGTNRLVFKPYTREQVQKIVQQRLDNSQNFAPEAVTYACKKMCTMTSDLRKILIILKRAQQNHSFSRISVQAIASLWKEVSGNQDYWVERMSMFHQKILNVLHQRNSVSDSEEILCIMTNTAPYTMREIQYGLNQLAQMGVVRLQHKIKEGLQLQKVILLKSIN